MTEQKDVKLLIATPAYAGNVQTDYVQSILALTQIVNFEIMFVGNESLITRARNMLISMFHQINLKLPDDEKYTHLLWLDADVGISADDIVKLVTSEHEITSAPVALKGFTKEGKPILNGKSVESGPIDTTTEWLQMEHIGTAVLCFTRKAVEALVEDAIKDDRYYQSSALTIGADQSTHFDIFRVGIRNGIYLSEDFWVCYQLRDLGFEIWCNTSIKTIHKGTHSFANMS